MIDWLWNQLRTWQIRSDQRHLRTRLAEEKRSYAEYRYRKRVYECQLATLEAELALRRMVVVAPPLVRSYERLRRRLAPRRWARPLVGLQRTQPRSVAELPESAPSRAYVAQD